MPVLFKIVVAFFTDFPIGVHPLSAPGGPAAENTLEALGSLVIVGHFFCTFTANVILFDNLRMLYNMNISNILFAAHHTCFIFSISIRSTNHGHIDYIGQGPSLMGQARYVPEIWHIMIERNKI